MQKLCSNRCNLSAIYNFPHIHITTEATKKAPEQTFIVCAVCRHDANSESPRCECHVSCHAQAREGVKLPTKPVAPLTVV